MLFYILYQSVLGGVSMCEFYSKSMIRLAWCYLYLEKVIAAIFLLKLSKLFIYKLSIKQIVVNHFILQEDHSPYGLWQRTLKQNFKVR